MLTSIAGSSAIVTGASKGIGKGIARVLASKGAHVLVVARSQDGAETTAAEICASGGSAAACAADVRKWEDVKQMAAKAVEQRGAIDILCANAGVSPRQSLMILRRTVGMKSLRPI
jgi:3-oxoacyl-[acyl-carrier protein] reductase